ncbi:phospholipase/lecithinase/hemolysin, lysophospholipase A, glycerophospholipid-cholesterol acyltransferase [Legionella beliardensis]|uniref:Phospholipase/lecithinase/hemolysin, lysophospholipase A, glycerophospholipid-cholesterol acyltransferase n=1 Tax=Legionella beliardensis TaxID=91822 RepID=A0A378HZ62_9GAMM|nr:SGNH/GDSL hydrolase family protein [Legionella beliardensis]STX27586.1 phospholipase/lecithinase/hemolysin, lysophospholipase A, glycerophospholipid-cholesterol acyltransferase [Legionella beliardensis]
MSYCTKLCRLLGVVALFLPMMVRAEVPVKSMVIFGDSLSDTGNTTHLLRSLRKEESPAYLVYPVKVFVINKMTEFAEEYYVPQILLDTGIDMVTDFFDTGVGPMLASLISKVKKAPLLPGEPYWQDHFSNGRVWDEYLAPMLAVDREDKRHFENKAFGGSWAVTYDYQLTVWNLIRHPLLTVKNLIVGKLIPPSIGLTVQAYLLVNEKLNEETVYFVFIGGNDYLNILRFGDNYDSTKMSAYIDNVINGLSSSVEKLVNAGAKHLVILGVPAVGFAPKFVNTADRELLNIASGVHNQRLAEKVLEWQSAKPDVDFLFIDIEPILYKAIEKPELFGFKNVTDACIDVKFPMFNLLADSPFKGNYVLEYAQALQYRDANFAPNERNYRMCDNPDDYLFWDEIHPTTKAHLFLANEICLAMKAHGYKTTCAQLVNR